MTAQEKPRLKIGGALRFNYNYSDWKPESRNRGGEFDFDVLRLNVNASYKKIDLARWITASIPLPREAACSGKVG